MFKSILKKLLILGLCLPLCGCVTFQTDLTQMLTTLYSNLQPVWDMLKALCWVLGIFFVAIGVLKLKVYGQMTVMMATHASMGPSLAYIIIGTGLLYIPHLLDIMTMSLWGYGFDAITGYPDDGMDNFSGIMIPLVRIVQVVGLIAFMRGWIMLLKLGQHGAPPGTLSKGLLHMLGGILAINIMGTIEVLRNTFGLV